MKEIKNDIEAMIKTVRKQIGPVRKGSLPDSDIFAMLDSFCGSIVMLISKVTGLQKGKRGSLKELLEECASLLEDEESYIRDIAGQYEETSDRTALADNLEEALDMLEDILYLDEGM